MEKFAESYTRGETPNPCIDCNRFLKFGALYERAQELGCDCVVTGHYARIRKTPEPLRTAAGPGPGQRPELRPVQPDPGAAGPYPISFGHLPQDQNPGNCCGKRFINSQKPDSQDICFVPNGSYTDAVQRILDYKPSPALSWTLKAG